MKPGAGYVVLEIPEAISSIKTLSGIELYVDTSFNPEQFANVYATVVEVPGLASNKKFKENRDLKHLYTDDEMRLQKGDKVFFHYLSIKNAKKQYNRGTYYEENGKRFAILPYASLFFAIRSVEHQREATFEEMSTGKYPFRRIAWFETEYIMLNDWVLIEPIRKGQHVEYIKGYGNAIIDDEATAGGKIQIISDTPYKASEGLVKACPPGCGLNVGDRIIFEKESDVPVEYDLCRTLEKPYWRMKLEDIVARRSETEVQLVRDFTLIVKDAAETETRSGFYIPEVSQKQPQRGKVVMVGPDVEEVATGETVMFEGGFYTEFPFEESSGVLVREGKIQIKLNTI